MKKIIIILIVVLLVLTSCSKTYMKSGVFDPTFNTNGYYKIAILPFLVRGETGNPSQLLRDRAYTKAQTTLMETGNFSLLDKFTIENTVDLFEFGSVGYVDPAKACEIGKELGVQLVLVNELSLTPIGNGLNIIYTAQIFDVATGIVVYSGQGRTTNPVSVEAGAEFAIDLAMKELIKKMK